MFPHAISNGSASSRRDRQLCSFNWNVVVHVGSDIRADVSPTNVGDHVLNVFWDKSKKAELEGFGIDVWDSKGAPVTATEYYRAVTGKISQGDEDVDGKRPRQAFVILRGGREALSLIVYTT